MRGEYSPPLLRVCRKWLRLGDLRVILQLGFHSLLLRQGLGDGGVTLALALADERVLLHVGAPAPPLVLIITQFV